MKHIDGVEHIEFIPEAGACLTTKNVMAGGAPIRWLDRGESRHPTDNGWRVFSAIDTSEYLREGSNWQVVDFNSLCMIEPALIGIWDFPVGSRLEFVDDGVRKRFIDSATGQEIPTDRMYVPPRHRT